MTIIKTIVIATVKKWNVDECNRFSDKNQNLNVVLIEKKEDLTYEFLKKTDTRYVFFPHWSWIIPKEIYKNFECIVFHCTDLPFGRGGSPLQNLISRGIYDTKISALKVCKGLDEGDIYLKYPLDISKGSAEDIFKNMSNIIFEKLIPKILNEQLVPIPQKGAVTTFERRKPIDSALPKNLTERQIYDFIRMLDGEGYPKAYIKHGKYMMNFSDATFENGKICAKMEMEILDE